MLLIPPAFEAYPLIRLTEQAHCRYPSPGHTDFTLSFNFVLAIPWPSRISPIILTPKSQNKNRQKESSPEFS